MILGFIGAGNMAAAILDGVISKGVFLPAQVIISNPSAEKLKHPHELGVRTTHQNREVVDTADLIILAVKPQKFDEVLEEIKGSGEGKCFVSIAAGITTEWIRERLPGAHVVRVMPNTPLQVGLGATAIAEAPDVPMEFLQMVSSVFGAAGTVAVLPEALMDAVIPVSGSSPAFFFRLIKVMVEWACNQGIAQEVALELAASTMKGAAEMLLKTGKMPEELVRQVCSPGGTTLAALKVLDDCGFDGSMNDSMTACMLRSIELGK